MKSQFAYEIDGVTRQISVERLPDGRMQAQIDGRTIHFEAQALGGDRWLLRLEDRQMQVAAAAQGNERFVHAAGQHHRLQLVTPQSARRKGRSVSASGELRAQMPGQVAELRAKPGDTVQAGQVLLILEAMKMEIRVTAPSAGVVQALHVVSQQIVERGQLLIELRPASDA